MIDIDKDLEESFKEFENDWNDFKNEMRNVVTIARSYEISDKNDDIKYWKKTLEELPDDGQEVIFRDYDNINNYGYYSKDDNKFWNYDGSGGCKNNNVKAWHAIPKYDL